MAPGRNPQAAMIKERLTTVCNAQLCSCHMHLTICAEPQRGPSRHQRAAQISEEVRLLNRETPPGPSQPPNDGADIAVGSQGTGELASSGRMGENVSPGREGPLAQGVGRPVRPQDETELAGETQQVRGTRDSTQGAEDPTQGGRGLLGSEQEVVGQSRVARPEEEEVDEEEEAEEDGDDGVLDQPDLVTQPRQQAPTSSRGPRIPPPGVPFQPPAPTREDLIFTATNTSTIAASNFSGVLAERIRTVAEPGQDPHAPRDLRNLASKLKAGQIVRFQSAEERQKVMGIIHGQASAKTKGTAYETAPLGPWGKGLQRPKDASGERLNYWNGRRHFQPLPSSVQDRLMEKLVKGQYDADGLLSGAQKYKQPVLNEIARVGLKNGTYSTRDGERMLAKVRTLLPASFGLQKAQGQQQARAASSAGAQAKGQQAPQQQSTLR